MPGPDAGGGLAQGVARSVGLQGASPSGGGAEPLALSYQLVLPTARGELARRHGLRHRAWAHANGSLGQTLVGACASALSPRASMTPSCVSISRCIPSNGVHLG